MFAQHPYSIAARLLAILAVALAFVLVLASSAARPASADASQWTRVQPHWWDHSNAWQKKSWHKSWDRSWDKPRHHRRHFKSSRPRIIIGTPGIVFSSPGFVFSSPGIIVTRPRIITNPGFVVRQPGFVVRDPNFAFDRPDFVVRHKRFFKHRDFQHKDFFKRHPSLGHHWAHKAWKRHHGRHPGIGHLPGGHGGIRFIRPGMH